MISAETNLRRLRLHPPTNTQSFHPDLLAPNGSFFDHRNGHSWFLLVQPIGTTSTSPLTRTQGPLH